MNKQKLSKQDHWLIQRWAKARQFEDAMESARQHYADLFREVYERVKKNWQELREYTPHRLAEKVTESAWEDGGGCVGFSELNWCRRWESWPSGIWLSNISLDELVTERALAPNACIWLSVSGREEKKITKLRQHLVRRRSRLRVPRSLRFEAHDPSDAGVCLLYDLPEERPILFKMMLHDDGRAFVDCMATHVERMARLLQGLDHLLR